MGVVGDRIGPTRTRVRSAQFGYLARLSALLAAIPISQTAIGAKDAVTVSPNC
jgi:hypothetical protein